jgi:membrane protein DedA with SNARE-associated domain
VNVEQLVHELTQLNPLWIYLAVAGISYVENIFPPFPSDVIVVAAGSLIGLGVVDFVAVLSLATIGSTSGFMTMYKIGGWFGDSILEKQKIRFIPLDAVKKAEAWFRHYGYGLIVANRFLAGTRAVVSFFAGIAELSLVKTTALSFVSALAWNFILLSAGKMVGQNWREIGSYLETYSTVVSVVIAIAAAIVCLRWFFQYRRSNRSSSDKSKEI